MRYVPMTKTSPLDESVSMDFGLYKPILPSEKEVSELESKMAHAYGVLSHCAIEWFNFANIKKLRNQYKKGLMPTLNTSNPRAKRVLDELISLETHIISCFIKLGAKMCMRHYKAGKRRIGLQYVDYVNECAFAIYDAMYTFNGKHKFTTYSTWCMKNRLIDFARQEDSINGFTQVIRNLRIKVDILVKSSNMTTDTAILFLKSSEELSDDVVQQLRESMFQVEPIYDTDKAYVVDEEAELALDTIKKVELSPLELDLVDAYLRNDRHRRGVLCKQTNPNTGKPYTPQRISQIFHDACEKLVDQYNLLKAA